MANIKDIINTTAKEVLNLNKDIDRTLSFARGAQELAEYIQERCLEEYTIIKDSEQELEVKDFLGEVRSYPIKITTDGKYIVGTGTPDNPVDLSDTRKLSIESFNAESINSWIGTVSTPQVGVNLFASFYWSNGSNISPTDMDFTYNENTGDFSFRLDEQDADKNSMYFTVILNSYVGSIENEFNILSISIPNPYYYVNNISYASPITGTGKTGDPVKLNYNTTQFNISDGKLNIKNLLKYIIGPSYWSSNNIFTLKIKQDISGGIGTDRVEIVNPYSGELLGRLTPTVSNNALSVDVSSLQLLANLDSILVYIVDSTNTFVSNAMILPVNKSQGA